MNAIRPNPTAVTTPSNAIVVLRNLESMLSPITPERKVLPDNACRILEATSTTIGHSSPQDKHALPKHLIMGRRFVELGVSARLSPLLKSLSILGHSQTSVVGRATHSYPQPTCSHRSDYLDQWIGMGRGVTKERVRRWLMWVGGNLDVLLALSFALVIALGEIVLNFSDRFLRTATIGLLGVIALALLRERIARTRVDDLATHLEAQDSNLPYEILDAKTVWDITDGGKHALVSKELRISLIRDRVSYVEDWWSGDGQAGAYSATWRHFGSGKDIPLKQAHKFKFERGFKYLLSFDSERRKGEILIVKIQRVIKKGFVFTPDAVGQAPWTRARKVSLGVIWSAEKPPTSVEIIRGGKGQNITNTARLKKSRTDGRAEYIAEFSEVASKERLSIGWTQ